LEKGRDAVLGLSHIRVGGGFSSTTKDVLNTKKGNVSSSKAIWKGNMRNECPEDESGKRGNRIGSNGPGGGGVSSITDTNRS